MSERNCNKCIHHTSGMCDSWDCKMQTVEDVKKEAVNEYAKVVVEELKERQKEYLASFGVHDNNELYGVACGLGDAIRIVKHGGVADDVCEWRLCDEEANAYDTSFGNPHILIEGTPRENNYEFCPYCGKKIKIVGD